MYNSETIVIKEGAFKGMNALEYVTWQDDEGQWYGCGTGYGDDNNLWEGDDLGPFDSHKEIINELDIQYEDE